MKSNEEIKVDVKKELLDGTLVGAIDQGTSSTRFLLFTVNGQIAASAQLEHPQLYPQAGWHEHDPLVLWKNTVACISAVCKAVNHLNKDNLAAIGITNQRETTIAWNRKTGRPYYHAIVWDDTRTADIAHEIAQTYGPALTKTTGLPVSSYFAGTKVKWLLDNVEALRCDVEKKPLDVCFGTVDSWLLWQLTGSVPKSATTGRRLKGHAGEVNVGGVFRTDVTNASRWLFMDLETCKWDSDSIAKVCAPHTLPESTLPEICPSSHVFGTIADCGLPAGLAGVPLASVLGDQQAALFGQAAFEKGQAKNTYGTGLFLMMNTGTSPIPSTHGLLTTVAYQVGQDEVRYALEGSVSHSGSTIQWLRDNLSIIESAHDSETLARTTKSNEGLYLVPAFAGLFAPHWRSDARGCIVGMTTRHHKGHICRAALEAAAYQTKEVFDAIVEDSNIQVQSLKVDGGGSHNRLLMQFQADMIQAPVVIPLVLETTSMGAAFAAGLAVGVWRDQEEIQKLWAVADVFEPQMKEEERAKNLKGWNRAVKKSLGWIVHGEEAVEDEPVKEEEANEPAKEEEVPGVRELAPVHGEEAVEDEPVKEEEANEPAKEEVPVVRELAKQEDSAVKEKALDVEEPEKEAKPTTRDVAPPSVPNSATTQAVAVAAVLGIGILLGRLSLKR